MDIDKAGPFWDMRKTPRKTESVKKLNKYSAMLTVSKPAYIFLIVCDRLTVA